jgi:hypothetical protein
MNVNDGGAEVVYHETPGGGAVFSVGSITWPACVLVDEACSTITRTVLARLLSAGSRRGAAGTRGGDAAAAGAAAVTAPGTR